MRRKIAYMLRRFEEEDLLLIGCRNTGLRHDVVTPMCYALNIITKVE
ncbi:MAG: hypothetical protein ABR547_09680 [Halanaerobium sp.]